MILANAGFTIYVIGGIVFWLAIMMACEVGTRVEKLGGKAVRNLDKWLGDTATDVGRRIVESHGGNTGEALAVSILARSDPVLAGRYVGQRIVDEHGGRTGEALAEEISRCT